MCAILSSKPTRSSPVLLFSPPLFPRLISYFYQWHAVDLSIKPYYPTIIVIAAEDIVQHMLPLRKFSYPDLYYLFPNLIFVHTITLLYCWLHTTDMSNSHIFSFGLLIFGIIHDRAEQVFAALLFTVSVFSEGLHLARLYTEISCTFL